MPVRCGCGREVSEWAAHCPACAADVTGRPLLVTPNLEMVATDPAPAAGGHPASGRRAFRPPPRRFAAVAASLGLAVAAAAILHGAVGPAGSAGANHSGAPGPGGLGPVGIGDPGPGPGIDAGGLPKSLGAAVVGYDDATDTLFVSPRAPISAATAAIASAALPGSQAVPAGPGGAVSLGTGVHAGRAVYIGRSGTTTDIGAADLVVPGAGSTVGIGIRSGGQLTVRILTVTRTASVLQLVPGPPVALPPGDQPVAVLAGGLVAVRTESNQLVIPGWGGSLPLGALGAVAGVTRTTLAWTAAAGCDPVGACPLRLTDLASGTTRTVVPPAGEAGFAVGGAFSPDGGTLLAFAVPPMPAGATLATLAPVYIDDRRATATRVLPGVPTRLVQGVPVGVAWWTADGGWAIYSGLLGSVRSATTAGAVINLYLPASYALVVL